MTEQEMVARARAGDQDAFEQLVLDNQKRIYTLCLRMTGDPEDGQDLAQEAFLNAWRGLPGFKGDSSFATWVYRLALKQAVEEGLAALPDHHRQVLVMRELSGLSYQEIGQALQLDLGTVKSRIARARLALKKYLEKNGNLSVPPPSK